MKRLIAFVLVVGCATGLLADEPHLANTAKVFPASLPAYKTANQYHAFTMRLSPDGQHVLYSRPVNGDEQPDDRSGRYELVLRELNGGDETSLPIALLESGWRYVPTRFNLFDAAGDRLVLSNNMPEARGRGAIEHILYDVAEARVVVVHDLADRGHVVTRLTADGQGLLVSTADNRRHFTTRRISLADPEAEAKPLTAPGWVQSVSPVGDRAVFFVPPSPRGGPPAPGERRQRPPMRLFLWDTQIDEELAELPTHPHNSQLDDLETQWTPDGRYLYYMDIEEAAEGRGPRVVTRVWDTQTGEPAGEIHDAFPMGPGPGPSLMVLARRTPHGGGGFLLHDAVTGDEFPLGDASQTLIHACDGKVLYAEPSAESGTEDVFSADLVVP